MPSRRARTEPGWSPAERRALRRLGTPAHVQALLDGFAYRTEDEPACPRRALAERRAHCLDGALLAAAALRRMGHAPAVLALWAVRDDGHVIAVYRERGGWGAVSKSNFSGLRARQPVYRTVRELVMSYFEDYFNDAGEFTLRSHTRPLDLRRLDHLGWEVRDEAVLVVDARLKALPEHHLLAPGATRRLGRVDARSRAAGMVGTDRAGLYRP